MLAQPLKFTPLDVHELALHADLVIAGVIREVRPKTFVIELEEPPLGWRPEQGPVPGKLEIGQFFNWTCACRWAPYAVGQSSLFHVKLPSTTSSSDGRRAHLRVLGAGNEGECPIIRTPSSKRQTVHTYFRPTVRVGQKSILTGRGPKRLIVSEREIYGVPIDYSVHIDALEGLRRAFRWHGDSTRLDTRIEQLLPDDDVDALARRSWVTDLLVRCGRADERLDA